MYTAVCASSMKKSPSPIFFCCITKSVWCRSLHTLCSKAIHQQGLFTQPAVAGAGTLAELHLRIYYHRWGGVAGWTKCNIKLSSFSYDVGRGLGLAELSNKVELDQLGLELWLEA